MRPAYLQVLHGRAISSEERDKLRIELLRPHVSRIRLDATFAAIPKPPSSKTAKEATTANKHE